MFPGRHVGAMGIAVVLSTAVAVGLIAGTDSLRADGRQDGQSAQAPLRPVIYKSLKTRRVAATGLDAAD